jgi:predicted nucleic acid-binding protein
MIIVDTSVWVEANRHPTGSEASVLRQLIDAEDVVLARPVRVELLSGVAKKDRTAFRRGLSALPVVWPTDDTWQQIEDWVPPAADKGQRFGISDLLIAALADELGALVWSLDSDFDRLEALGLVQRYVPL